MLLKLGCRGAGLWRVLLYGRCCFFGEVSSVVFVIFMMLFFCIVLEVAYE